jgi:acyl-coenzyme A thioesterase PaaI-like protein
MNEAARRAMNIAFHGIVPLNNKIGIVMGRLAHGVAHTTLPPNPALANDQGHLHNGALSIILDTTSGMAAFMSLDEMMPFATLNMRIDYHHVARVDKPTSVVSTLYTKSGQVITFHATAKQEGVEVASAVVTFMLGTPVADPNHIPAWAEIK